MEKKKERRVKGSGLTLEAAESGSGSEMVGGRGSDCEEDLTMMVTEAALFEGFGCVACLMVFCCIYLPIGGQLQASI